jgi:hypothetical protein
MQNRKRIYIFTPVKQTVLEDSSLHGCDVSTGEYLYPPTQHHFPQLSLQQHLCENLISHKTALKKYRKNLLQILTVFRYKIKKGSQRIKTCNTLNNELILKI